MRARPARPLVSLALLHASLLAAAIGCGDAERVNLDDDGTADPDGGSAAGDDAGAGGGGGGPCEATKAQCNNCIDDDEDGLIDGDDPHCAGPLDDDEETFATGIPGDNEDPKKQDCFFDGNSGRCQIHTCCLLPEPCDEETFGNFDRDRDCTVGPDCVEECAPITPPGCDCYGCCTVCTPGTSDCFDVLVNPAISPDCSVDDLASDDCVKCIKSEECVGGECDPEACILCPGQTEDDLPAECNDMNQCPGDGATCGTSADCDDNDYCSSGCCIGAVD
jgi:hypothetical protein